MSVLFALTAWIVCFSMYARTVAEASLLDQSGPQENGDPVCLWQNDRPPQSEHISRTVSMRLQLTPSISKASRLRTDSGSARPNGFLIGLRTSGETRTGNGILVNSTTIFANV